jgi:hypothetical protein
MLRRLGSEARSRLNPIKGCLLAGAVRVKSLAFSECGQFVLGLLPPKMKRALADPSPYMMRTDSNDGRRFIIRHSGRSETMPPGRQTMAAPSLKIRASGDDEVSLRSC